MLTFTTQLLQVRISAAMLAFTTLPFMGRPSLLRPMKSFWFRSSSISARRQVNLPVSMVMTVPSFGSAKLEEALKRILYPSLRSCS